MYVLFFWVCGLGNGWFARAIASLPKVVVKGCPLVAEGAGSESPFSHSTGTIRPDIKSKL